MGKQNINKRIKNNISERKCTKCEGWFPETNEYFYLMNKSKPEKGFQSECKKCMIKRSRQNVLLNPERTKQTYLNWYNLNHESELKRYREYWMARPEQRNKKYKNFLLNNPEKAKLYSFNRKHKNHIITDEQWEECKRFFDYRCCYCGLHIDSHYRFYAGKLQKIDLHKEHVDDEGSNGLENCVPSCGSCNYTKNSKTLEEWYTIDNPIFKQGNLDKIYLWLFIECWKYII